MHVLIVDDDPSFSKLVQEVVTDAMEGRLFITLAATGDAALMAIHDSDSIDVGILDVRLPGPSGVVVARRLREKNRYALIIVVTGSDLVEDTERQVRNAGADRFLRKDAFVDELLVAIAQHRSER